MQTHGATAAAMFGSFTCQQKNKSNGGKESCKQEKCLSRTSR
jgi:hypothetical protein